MKRGIISLKNPNCPTISATIPALDTTLYYVTDNTLDEDGNIVANSVYMFDVRYEFDTTAKGYLLKIIVESADKSRNGAYTYHYVMR